eukprot:754255-Amphidinium_carterae.1
MSPIGQGLNPEHYGAILGRMQAHLEKWCKLSMFSRHVHKIAKLEVVLQSGRDCILDLSWPKRMGEFGCCKLL